MKSIVVLISGNGSNLQAIMDAIDNKQIDGKVVAVISDQGDAYGLTRAKQAGIATDVLSYDGFTSRQDYDRELLLKVQQYSPELIVLAGFMRILSDFFVEQYADCMVNIHPSLLPKYKGLNTHTRAIQAGDKEHGASVHFVTATLDDGPVVIQAKVPVFDNDDEAELAARVQEQERKIYPLVVKWFCENRLKMENGIAKLDHKTIPETGYASE
jgi:phosphoribosylglycinamide formyltransferase-1